MALQRVAIDELQLGSYVVAVTRQRGDIVVKDAGWVRSPEALALLKQKGVLEVAIDPAKQLPAAPAPTEATTEPKTTAAAKPPRISFEQEINKAELAFSAGTQSLQASFPKLLEQEELDFHELSSVSNRLLESTKRNSQALLFLQQVSQQNDALLQHSLSCACLMAAFAARLKLPAEQAQLYTLAALLHDSGALLLQQLYPNQPYLDSDATSYSIPMLQQQPDCPAELLQMIEEHCLSLAQQQSLGGKMLAIVNSYSKLTAAGKNSLQAAASLKKAEGKTLDSELCAEFLQCVGLYSPGTVVRLKSGKLGLVLENHSVHPDKPKLKLFYHSLHRHHLPAKLLDLSKQSEEVIESCADLKKYQLELQHYL
ncbi:HD-GYP domain-containing protein [Rheinheimera sp.]|uniref:HD-GYP domain-containing protein n=1 Tax=Rheinheimera sp. TaxID=1869214 RepID=UPI002FDD22CB